MRLDELIDFGKLKPDEDINEGSLILINVYFLRLVSGVLLTGNLEKLESNKKKRRPIVVYKTKNRLCSFLGLSTNKHVHRKYEIIFDFSNCNDILDCKNFKFESKSSVFVPTQKVKKNGKIHYVPKRQSFNFNIDTILSYKLSVDKINEINRLTSQYSDFDGYFKVCTFCNIEYVKNIAKRLNELCQR
ncbi:MAG: hypothetical protein PWQ25_1805 [Deferribacteres bacterium]|jgi:hypothetical protein|nr:hypothetical protein [Deferribacteraceae bacterium]MDK2792942.1 hypothetical protein [Deferribacteres bacterium]